MVKKMGRPTDNPRTYNTRIRMNEDEVRVVTICADKLGMTRSDVLRLGLSMVYEEIIKK